MNTAPAPTQPSFDALITRILARFASSSTADVDRDIQTSLGEIARFVGADYAHVVRTADDQTSWSIAYEWCSEIAPSQLAAYQQVPMGSWAWPERVLLAGEVLRFNSLDEVPPEESAARALFASVSFKSTLHVPIRRPGGRVGGCVALSSLAREVTWDETDVARLRLVGDAVATAMERARVERELRDSESRYRATFEHAPVGILNVDRERRLIQVNQHFCDMLGYAADELIGRHFCQFTHAEDVSATERFCEQVFAERAVARSLEKRYLRKDGQVVWGNLTLSRLLGNGASSEMLIAAIEDITARKQADETFDAVPDLIFVTDLQQRVVRANRATAQRLGVPHAEVLGRRCHEVLRGGHTTCGPGSHEQLAGEGQPHQFESHEPHLGGDFLISCTPVRDARGHLTGTVHVARDVTELRESEAALRRAHEALQQRRALVVAASLDGAWEWDTQSEEVQYSDRFAELLGYAPHEVPQTLDFFRSILHGDDADLLWDAVHGHLTAGMPYDVECRLRTKSGAYRWFRTRGQAQRDEAGRPAWMAGALQDIHRQKTAEHELRQALDQVQHLTERLSAENVYLREEITSALGFSDIIGTSQPLRSVLEQIEHVSATNASVLLLGETGTGKELLARAIHDRSPRRARPLVKVNLAALPASLIESELFGHVKGAFTGALSDKVGRFQLAHGGTLFLDEIGELDPELQTKLLRVLQEGEFERIGSSETQRVDVRIVAATNRDLRRALDETHFRPDLYYRLAVFPIEVPPLRLRRDDIPLLTWHFIVKKQVRLGRTIHSIPAHVMRSLMDYDWPGNVRELENVIERAMILTPGSALTLPEPLKSVPRPIGSQPS
ncbi:MAG: sigma 54-interacting transcriptional regulator, partial [Pirellulaceae bacterium]|nr:sigma 54-interacting transcriptional regulator [Pirellulaceae bacterium]